MGYIIKDNSLWDISDDIIIYLTDSQVDMIKLTLKEYVEKNKKVKTHKQQNRYLYNEDGKHEFEDWKIKPESEGTEEAEEKIVKDILPLAGDTNTIAKTDANYSQEALNNFKTSAHNFTYKIKTNWVGTGLIDETQYNSLIESIVLSSPAAHNDWVYSLSGEKDSKQGRERITLDIHDRRIDDPNFALVVRGGVTVGDPENPQDRKKMTVLGETELQDGTAFGRLLDTYGEKNPMDFGHQIPDHGKYPKVYINRGEDRYNGEDWDDGTYGLGQGTIEAYKEIVSHTTVSADRGMIIEDGVGDPTDRVIEKTELTYYFITYDNKIKEYIVKEIIEEEIPDGADIEQVDALPTPSEETAGYYVIEKNENSFDPIGEFTHQTEGFALSIHHDGAKIQGHTYIEDEEAANEFYLVGNNVYQVDVSDSNGPTYLVEPQNIKTECWFCAEGEDGQSNDSQYTHYCMNNNGEVEPLEDKWFGFLYYEGLASCKGQAGWKYRVYSDNDNFIEYYLDNGQFKQIIVTEPSLENGDYYRQINGDIYYKHNSENLEQVHFKGEYTNNKNRSTNDSRDDYPIYYVKDLTMPNDQSDEEDIFSYTANIRVVPEIKTVYKINRAYTERDPLYGLVAVGAYNTGDYFYWDGAHFIKISSYESQEFNNRFGSLTIGTRAESQIGRNSIEVGQENEASGDCSEAQGVENESIGKGSHAEGLQNKALGQYSHAEGLGNIANEDYQHLEGKYSNNANINIPTYYHGDSNEETNKSIRFAIGNGDSNNKRANAFAVTEDGDAIVQKHFEVGGTSDLQKRVTIGSSSDLQDHELALEVFKHSKFDQNVTIERDVSASLNGLDAQMDWSNQPDNSLKVKGQSLFGDTVTIGKAGNDGTFWSNLDELNQQSMFIGLEVHGEIRNERIPEELYSSYTYVDGQNNETTVYNQFADKFFVNSSVSTNTATFRGNFGRDDYEPREPIELSLAQTTLYEDLNEEYQYVEQLVLNLPNSANAEENVIYVFNDKKYLYRRPLTKKIAVKKDDEIYENYNDLPDKIYNISGETRIGKKFVNSEDNDTYIYYDYFDPQSENEVINFLNNNNEITRALTSENITDISYNELLSLLPNASIGQVYRVKDESFDGLRYYECKMIDSQKSWEWVYDAPNNNDYCFVQFEEEVNVLPYVLYDYIYEEGNSDPVDIYSDENNSEISDTSKKGKNIIIKRYKYITFIDPVSLTKRIGSWKFEYQVNNSGYTQKQWDAINSGITPTWMYNTTTAINNEIIERTRNIQNLQSQITSLNSQYNQLINVVNSNISSKVDQRTFKTELTKYVQIAKGTVQEPDIIIGFKKFANDNGIQIGNSQLKQGGEGIFILPQANSGELALKSEFNNYVSTAKLETDLQSYALVTSLEDYYTKDQINNQFYTKEQIDQADYIKRSAGGETQSSLNPIPDNITGFKYFSNSNGIKINDSILKGGANSIFYLPSEKSGELALKQDLLNITTKSVPLTYKCSGYDDETVVVTYTDIEESPKQHTLSGTSSFLLTQNTNIASTGARSSEIDLSNLMPNNATIIGTPDLTYSTTATSINNHNDRKPKFSGKKIQWQQNVSGNKLMFLSFTIKYRVN